MAIFVRSILIVALILIGRSEMKTDAVPMESEQLDQMYEARVWADTTYANMTLDERIGQLIMIRAHSDLGPDHIANVKKLIKEDHVGSMCFFQGTPEKQLELTNEYQALAKVPLIVAVDAEWGLSMRLKEHAMNFPKNMALGAIQDDALIYEMGREVARQMKRMGMHLNFSPVVDVNNNKNNPVINSRSFGERTELVSEKGAMMMMGMQSEGVMACAKHFPGHGDTDLDSHYDLPLIPHDRARLDSIELRPFQRLIARGIQSIMVAHLEVPALEGEENVPTTLSKNTVTDLLKEEMSFNGLIITDAMEMVGVTKHFPAGEAEARALAAGNDIICLPRDVKVAVAAIKKFMNEGKISESRLAESVKKILVAKYNLGLTSYIPITTDNLTRDLFPSHAKRLLRKLYKKSLTLVRNEKNNIPLNNPSDQTAILDIGLRQRSQFQFRMMNYGVGVRDIHRVSKGGWTEGLLNKLSQKKHVIVAFHDMSISPNKSFGIHHEDVKWVEQLALLTDVTVVLFGNPYALQYFDKINTVAVGYDSQDEIQDLMAQALCGAVDFMGKLPVTASSRSRSLMGETPAAIFRLGFATPEDVGMSSFRLLALDTLMEEVIERKAAPGGQILVIKDGQVVFQKAYGHHTYDKKVKVENHHVYDLASVTKILASTYSVMDLFDQGKVSVFRPVSQYIPQLKETDKKDIILEDMLIHSARLKAWIPFYTNTLDTKKRPDKKWYSKTLKEPFTIPVAKDLYMNRSYQDSMWHYIFGSELYGVHGYRYSDLGFYLADRMVTEVSGQRIDRYAADRFYKPMGLQRTTYNPLDKIPISEIAPTEEDKYFRFQKLQGHVHDMGAAMRGGVSGHAGLFSNAYEVGVMMQTLLNGGYYGGRRYFHPVTVSLFTARPEGETRRGLGFDMKQLDMTKSLNMSQYASYKTFGHLGFTGTCAWADPMQNLVFVFLSNRTYPDMKNNLLGRDDYRPRLQSIVYRSILEPVNQ